MKIAIVDTYYPGALKAIYAKHPGLERISYREQRDQVLLESFGTSDFVSAALGQHGWDAQDFIVNCEWLQCKWCVEKNVSFVGTEDYRLREIVLGQIREFFPDVLFVQDLSFFPADVLKSIKTETGCHLVAQCSCPWPGNEQIQAFDLIFTSFPHYLAQIEALGVKAQYLPLAFDPRVLQRIDPPTHRDLDVSFVGGWGRHWERGPKDFEILAREVPMFRWWGYGAENLPADSALRKAYQGEAWGLDMYEIYARSKIVVNRHGEVARGCGNNLRQYEATGTGALLLTDCAGQFQSGKEVVVYTDGNDLVQKAKGLLIHQDERLQIAEAGYNRTISEHTYRHRAAVMTEAMRELCGK